MTDRDVTIRPARPEDASLLARLAGLDSGIPPALPALIALVDGEPWAAVSMDGGQVVADPFRPAADVVALLTLRAAQLRDAAPQASRFTLRSGRRVGRTPRRSPAPG